MPRTRGEPPPHVMLDGVDGADAATARHVLDMCTRLVLAAGETPAADGEVALVVVDQGLLVVRTSSPSTARTIVTCDAAAGAVLPGPAANETLVPLLPSVITLIPTDARDVLLELPMIAKNVTDALQRAARRAREQAEIFVSTRNRERVRQRLLQLARDHGRVTRTGVRLDFPLTHELLAAMTGSARESATRAVDELEREGFLVRDGRRYRLLVQPEALR